MKTYTLEEFEKFFGRDRAFHPKQLTAQWDFVGNSRFIQIMRLQKPLCVCTCIRILSKTVKAYKNCKNCLGYGIMPISLEEL